MDHLTCTLESFLTFRDKDTGEIIAIEHQNGKLERYTCEIMTVKQSQDLFGVSKVASQ